MFDAAGSRGALRPSLSTLSTSIAQTERNYSCPANMGRILCASGGGCVIELDDERRIHLIGARMVFLSGPATYRLIDAEDGFTLTTVDIFTEPGRLCGCGLGELATAFPELKRLSRQPGQCVVFYDNFAMVMSSVQAIHSFSRYDKPQRELQISLTLSFLLAAIATSSWDEDLKTLQYSKHVRAALQYIHENYMCNITTTDVAAAAGVHIGHLHRIFLAETGYRIGEYITNVRIEKAKSLLMRTDIPTAAIAHRVNVNTPQYFSRLFKQRVGMTPQTFRRSYNLTCDYSSRDQYSIEYATREENLR